MRIWIFLIVLAVTGCQAPNQAASTPISTAPMSRNPTETMPSTSNERVHDNRIRQNTGTAPSNEQLPDSTGSPSQSDSTSKR